jgi:ERCC4-type nuclease
MIMAESDQADIRIRVTKPNGPVALALAERGMRIIPIEEDEGDVDRYLLSECLAIERRTGSSLLGGIMDKTLFTSAIYLRENFDLPVLILEGEVNYEYTAFNPQAVRGALASMVTVYGMSVLSTPDVEETAALIAMLAQQEQVGVPEISLIPKRKAMDLPDMQRRVVEMLPGCGMVTARDLLAHFGSVRRIMNAGQAELQEVRGIGPKKAAEMVRVLNAEYETLDTERQLEDAIQAEQGLLFEMHVELLDRQHYIFTQDGERQFVDLVFVDGQENTLYLVELKRGKLTAEHEAQLRGYLDGAQHSQILKEYLDSGAGLQGILATVKAGGYEPLSEDIRALIVDRERAIQVLKRLRDERLSRGVG